MIGNNASASHAARLLIAILAIYGFVLQGFGRDAVALARMTPQAQALCLPGSDAVPDHAAGQACDLHCLGAQTIAGAPGLPPESWPFRFAIPNDCIVAAVLVADHPQFHLAYARAPPQLI